MVRNQHFWPLPIGSNQPSRAELRTITHATSFAKSLDSGLDWATTFAAADMGLIVRESSADRETFGEKSSFRRRPIGTKAPKQSTPKPFPAT
jgi:hypothetical protein